MAWHPLGKRPYLSSRPMISQGLSSHLEDRELQMSFQHLQELEDHSKKLYKEVKRYEECVQSMHKLEHKMSSELCNSPACRDDDSSAAALKKVADDFYAFRKNYSIWGDAQRMESTYLK